MLLISRTNFHLQTWMINDCSSLLKMLNRLFILAVFLSLRTCTQKRLKRRHPIRGLCLRKSTRQSQRQCHHANRPRGPLLHSPEHNFILCRQTQIPNSFGGFSFANQVRLNAIFNPLSHSLNSSSTTTLANSSRITTSVSRGDHIYTKTRYFFNATHT